MLISKYSFLGPSTCSLVLYSLVVAWAGILHCPDQLRGVEEGHLQETSWGLGGQRDALLNTIRNYFKENLHKIDIFDNFVTLP